MTMDIAADVVSNVLLLIGLFLPPLSLCFFLGWLGLEWWNSFKDWKLRQRLLRNSPCCKCLYFAGFQNLHCAVNPCQALTDEAQYCLDFTSASPERCEQIGVELMANRQLLMLPSDLMD